MDTHKYDNRQYDEGADNCAVTGDEIRVEFGEDNFVGVDGGRFVGVREEIAAMQESCGSRFGTERTRALLDALGSPDDALKIVHVAGTDGKGSICAYLTAVFMVAGVRCGTYTSPAVFDKTEQYLLCGEPCDDEKLDVVLEEALRVAKTLDPVPTAFEIETAAAFLLFYREDMEFAVIECGLGGELDATNAVGKKEVALISSVSMEHTDVLGDNLRDICRAKAGIVVKCPAIISCCQSDEARIFLEEFTSVSTFSGEGMERLSSDSSGQEFSYEGQKYSIAMHGVEQCYNACVAIDCARILGLEGYAIKEGLAVAKLPGRCDVRKKCGKTFILDGAHNVAAFGPLKSYVETNFADTSRTVIFGCLSDKNADGICGSINALADQYIGVRPQSPRAMDMNKIMFCLEKHCKNVTSADSLEEALRVAEGDVVIVCGSFTMLAEAEKWINREQ